MPRFRPGVTPSMAPLFSPSGLVYRYVLESPDRSPQELKTYEDWIIERAYAACRESPTIPASAGTAMQYQVLLDPARLYGYHLTVAQVVTALTANNSNTGGGFYSQGGQFYYVRGIGLLQEHRRHRRSGGREQQRHARAREGCQPGGHRQRAAPWHFWLPDQTTKNDDAVEGVILMRRGEQPQNVLQGVEKKTEELNRQRPAAGRKDSSLLRPQRPGARDHRHRGRQPAPRHGAGTDRADFFPGQLSRRGDHRADGSAGAAVRLYFSARHAARPPTCFPSAPSISASSSTARSSWWRTSTAN